MSRLMMKLNVPRLSLVLCQLQRLAVLQLLILLLLLCATQQSLGYPNINQAQAKTSNYLQQLDKSYFQRPELEQTIDEVQKILANDPALPRLTRGEIEELYEKVTREEYEKSIEAGDLTRADSMRALMLVLPYNTDNNTEENLQELYTRPPVTKVIDAYTPPDPIKFITPDPSSVPRTDNAAILQTKLDATTYKPAYPHKPQIRQAAAAAAATPPNPTTYHPPAPAPIMYQMTPSMALNMNNKKPSMQFQPITKLPYAYDYAADVVAQLNGATVSPSAPATPTQQRFSSHYNAKNAAFLQKTKPLSKSGAGTGTGTTTTTVKPVADILESLGIVGQTQAAQQHHQHQHHQHQQRNRYALIDDYYPAESAPKPIITSYVPQTASIADLRGLQATSAQIKPDAYTNFKPLNIGEELRVKPEVEGYLTRFGIVKKSSKALKKNQQQQQQQRIKQDEPASEESEIATAKVPSSRAGGAGGGNTELAKLLENLQELERLQTKLPKTRKLATTTTTTKAPTTTTTTRATTTTTSPTTPQPTASLITNGAPLLIEPKKPRRRIDPNIDINFAATGNHHQQQAASESGNAEQLAKLLTNLQELERLRVNPENVLKQQLSNNNNNNKAQAHDQNLLTNRFSQAATTTATTTTSPSDAQELQLILKQLQQLEQQQQQQQAKRTTTTTTKRPKNGGGGGNLGVNDFAQLQRLLSDDRELERLYEQARKKAAKATTTTTTKRPNLDIAELQAYLAQLERATPTTTTTTTSSTTTTTTPRPITQADLAQRIGDLGGFGGLGGVKVKPTVASTVNHAQFEALINRVQQLERFNTAAAAAVAAVKTTTTTTAAPSVPTAAPSNAYLGFTTRNVQTASVPIKVPDYRVPLNDFAQLQQLYQQAVPPPPALPAVSASNNYGIEISTAATTGKKALQQQQQQKSTEDLATRIFDLTNETGSGASLQDVDPNDYVQLQKLLSKVQELERVKLKPNDGPTVAPNLVTAASIRTQSVKSLNGAQIVYAVPPTPTPTLTATATPPTFVAEPEPELELKLDLPVYVKPSQSDTNSKLSSSEELHELIMSKPANPLTAGGAGNDFAQYQEFFSQLTDNERLSYQNLKPPMIQKTTTTTKSNNNNNREPPRFVPSAAKPTSTSTSASNALRKQQDLQELQKLLYNAQELKKLGVALPNELSEQLETKLAQSSTTTTTTTSTTTSTSTTTTTTTTPAPTTTTTTRGGSDDSSSPAVFSLTTTKPLQPREPKTTTESTIELPVFSATKIIEAAIKRAANRIGVSTEQNFGFRRRSDDDADETVLFSADNARQNDADNDDLMAEFSELNYQLALPPETEGGRIGRRSESDSEERIQIVTPMPMTALGLSMEKAPLGQDLSQLQRLISNLQELQKLNVSLTAGEGVGGGGDGNEQTQNVEYFDSLRAQAFGTADTKKERRQNNESTTTTTPADVDTDNNNNNNAESSTQAPTRISLDLGLSSDDSSNDADDDNGDKNTNTSTSTTPTTPTSNDDDSVTEESRNGSLVDLEDSFGPNPNTQEPLPAKKKNGFYFLADWNSFLEVGDGDDQVVVRLSPKIGDPRLFLPVKVP